jgi:uncharacterized protein
MTQTNNMEKHEAIKQYLALRDEIDQRCQELHDEHAPHLQCRAGCDMCCMDFGILPVEFEVIKELAGDELKKGQPVNEEGACPFLVNHRCVIYHFRPIICRTQGLPLLFMGEEEWELSACELNFTAFDFDEFTKENTFAQDKYNSRLFMLNRRFVDALSDKPYSPVELIRVSSLKSQP